VAAKDEAFARGMISALIEFGLGRPCGFSDEPLVDSLLLQARAKNLSLRATLHALIQSEPFHMK
jgi:hypothetical protein